VRRAQGLAGQEKDQGDQQQEKEQADAGGQQQLFGGAQGPIR
jgi:hypothetical protein